MEMVSLPNVIYFQNPTRLTYMISEAMQYIHGLHIHHDLAS